MEESLVARRLFCQFVSDGGRVKDIILSREMLQSYKKAWNLYTVLLLKEKTTGDQH